MYELKEILVYAVGDSVDLHKAQLLTLGREGDADIYRVSI